MARILLEPNEIFEHTHTDRSQTIHVQGDIEMTISEVCRRLEPKEVVDIPPGCAHSLRNIGCGVAEITCLHL